MQEEFTIPEDIDVMYIEASSFPDGVQAAHDKIFELTNQNKSCRYFGISWPDQTGKIMYKAAAEIKDDKEAEKSGLQTFTIRKGNYISEVLHHWHGKEQQMGTIFQQLLAHPGLAHDGGYCLEEYLPGEEVRLMVTLKTI